MSFSLEGIKHHLLNTKEFLYEMKADFQEIREPTVEVSTEVKNRMVLSVALRAFATFYAAIALLGVLSIKPAALLAGSFGGIITTVFFQVVLPIVLIHELVVIARNFKNIASCDIDIPRGTGVFSGIAKAWADARQDGTETRMMQRTFHTAVPPEAFDTWIAEPIYNTFPSLFWSNVQPQELREILQKQYEHQYIYA